ncbi:hypothetical protein IW262DRAFT_536750 [Armillaria fumosa]|nr:hypothetical protein IW262DRAFT_536750 [Armillaria fumosa]
MDVRYTLLTALHEVVKVIHSFEGNYSTLSELGRHFRSHFIRLVKKFKGRTPASSDHPSCHSFDVLKRDLRAKITEGPRRRNEAKQLALIRDGFRCVVTASYHYDSLSEVSASAAEIN